MGAYLLQDLVRVREFREDRASKALSRAQRLVEEAKKSLQEKEKQLKTYKIWQIEEEERLIQSIMLKKVQIGDIQDLRLDIVALKDKEFELIDSVKKAEAELDRALDELKRAQKKHIETVQDLEKLLEHRETWLEEEKAENELREELELEDFVSRPLFSEVA